MALNPDATEEFRVITNNFMPEFGRNNGAVIDVVTKNGSNALHGSAYWFGRYDGFGGARDYFNHNIQRLERRLSGCTVLRESGHLMG